MYWLNGLKIGYKYKFTKSLDRTLLSSGTTVCYFQLYDDVDNKLIVLDNQDLLDYLDKGGEIIGVDLLKGDVIRFVCWETLDRQLANMLEYRGYYYEKPSDCEVLSCDDVTPAPTCYFDGDPIFLKYRVGNISKEEIITVTQYILSIMSKRRYGEILIYDNRYLCFNMLKTDIGKEVWLRYELLDYRGFKALLAKMIMGGYVNQED